MRKTILWLLTMGLGGIGMSASAQDNSLETNLKKLLPGGMTIQSIQDTPMQGVYEVTANNQTLYVYSKGSYLMIGDVYDMDRRVSLGEEKQNRKMSAAIEALSESEMILMGQKKDRYVTVFTDTDCVYCQRFHLTVSELDAKGLQVRYLMFPRAGLDSESYREAVSVWCADDQAAAMTLAKAGGTVEEKQCDNPVADQYQLGQEIGVRGTPTMVLDNGKVIPGYLPANELLVEAGMTD